jgi:hypothetical protein
MKGTYMKYNYKIYIPAYTGAIRSFSEFYEQARQYKNEIKKFDCLIGVERDKIEDAFEEFMLENADCARVLTFMQIKRMMDITVTGVDDFLFTQCEGLETLSDYVQKFWDIGLFDLYSQGIITNSYMYMTGEEDCRLGIGGW